MAAQRNDPELAEIVAGLPDEATEQWRPPAAEWGLETALLAEIRDRLGVVTTLLGDQPAAVKKRSKPPAPFPRPRTAIDRARAAAEARLEEALDDLVAAAHENYAAEQRDDTRSEV